MIEHEEDRGRRTSSPGNPAPARSPRAKGRSEKTQSAQTGMKKSSTRAADRTGKSAASTKKTTASSKDNDWNDKDPKDKESSAGAKPASSSPQRTRTRAARPDANEGTTAPRELAAETMARAARTVWKTPPPIAVEQTTPLVSDATISEPDGSRSVANSTLHLNSERQAVAPSKPEYPPFLGELDLYLTGEGKHYRLWEKMGAHRISSEGREGVAFAVWAPNASAVSVIGDFNQWDGRKDPMRSLGDSGIWYAFVPDLEIGQLYKYEIRTREGHLRIKSDPYSFACEMRPRTASVIWDINQYGWNDEAWMESRRGRDWRREPMSVYEVHLGSWMRALEDDHRWLNYREIAPRLVDHVKRYNFTHVELLPVAEHLLDQSWGYQVTGYFAPTSRHGNPDDFKYLVDQLHQAGVGVIIDWVPAHFPKDDTGLRWFDGTALYEHADPKQGEQVDWGTLIFNYGRHEVRNFLLANALFWLDVYHVDGLRVDAVASMLYLDYSKRSGEWIPNKYGGKENLEAIDLLRKANELIYGLHPGAFTVAEESTDWGGVTLPTYLGGLGFGFKWDMGWMHDTLVYFSKDPVHRSYHHNTLTFAMLYAYTENFIMPLSHDEVVHGKGSLISKMPGDEWQRFANLRTLYAYMFTRPGKKLLFMGAEFAQDGEWRSDHSLDWHLSQYPIHKGIETLLEDLGRLYRDHDCLWYWDTEPQGYQWIDCSDSVSSVVSYLRRGPSGSMVVALNLTPVPRLGYRVGVPEPGYYREVLNTDSEVYGGSNMGNGGGLMAEEIPFHGYPWSVNLKLPPLAGVVLEPAR